MEVTLKLFGQAESRTVDLKPKDTVFHDRYGEVCVEEIKDHGDSISSVVIAYRDGNGKTQTVDLSACEAENRLQYYSSEFYLDEEHRRKNIERLTPLDWANLIIQGSRTKDSLDILSFEYEVAVDCLEKLGQTMPDNVAEKLNKHFMANYDSRLNEDIFALTTSSKNEKFIPLIVYFFNREINADFTGKEFEQTCDFISKCQIKDMNTINLFIDMTIKYMNSLKKNDSINEAKFHSLYKLILLLKKIKEARLENIDKKKLKTLSESVKDFVRSGFALKILNEKYKFTNNLMDNSKTMLWTYLIDDDGGMPIKYVKILLGELKFHLAN